MSITRRGLLRSAGAMLAAGAWAERLWAGPPPLEGIRIGSCTVGFDDAQRAGLDGVELRVGGAADRLEIADSAVRRRHKEKMKETGLVVSSLMMGLLNSYPLASDPRGPAWLEQSIEAAADLGAKVILVAFFGRGDLLAGDQLKQKDADVVVERLRAAAPAARQAGVTLAIENYLSARQNLELIERIGHEAVRVYYDVRNSTDKGYNPAEEILLLKDHIVQFHFKDGANYLGEGKVDWPAAVGAIRRIGYRGWIVLETSSPSGDSAADARRNAERIRKWFVG